MAPNLLSILKDPLSPESELNKSQILLDLFNCRKPLLYYDTIPNPIPHYIRRKLITRNNTIDKRTPKENTNKIFVFDNIEYHVLCKVLRIKSAGLSSNEIKRGTITSRFIILENLSHFDRICELSDPSTPAH